ncbi:MAG: FG-GAP repeat domain-containing protein [Candidatus Binataceae bacterium]
MHRCIVLGLIALVLIGWKSVPTLAQTTPSLQPAPTPNAAKLPQPPDGRWLKDANGYEYFIDRLEKTKATRIDQKTVRMQWGFNMDVVKEDDKYYYYKVYKPMPAVTPRSEPTISAEDRRKIVASYRVATKDSERLRFTPFGDGLPASGEWRQGFSIADMNGDGHLDIVAPPPRKSNGAPPSIFLGNGKGSWTRWSQAHFPNLAYDYGDVQIADLNGDGHPDLALAVHLRGIIVLFGDGQGGFREADQGIEFDATGGKAFSSQALRILDWNGDGKPDILALSEGPTLAGIRIGHSSTGVALYLNKGNGSWERPPPQQSSIFGDSLTIGDFNGDGHPDFATSTGAMNRRDLVNLWKTDRTWEPVTVNELRPMAYVWSVAAADFDEDGRADLAVAYSSYEMGTWRSGIDVLFPRADKHWDRRTLEVAETREGPVALGVGDLTGNGHKDIAALTAQGETWIFLGDGRGSFTREKTPPPPYPGGCRGSHVALADLDGDGQDELVTSFSDEPSFSGHCPSFGGLTAWKAHPLSNLRESKPIRKSSAP